jgi:hypothetical protein
LAQFGFVEANSPFGMGSIDHTSASIRAAPDCQPLTTL